MFTHEFFMQRALDLALQGEGMVAPNPMVGAVLVYQNRIIGEGFHAVFGGPHAEVNALAAVAPADRPYISKSTLYVSLEPCAHQGKTPPCSQLIVKESIPQVVVACRDPFPAVNGKGLDQLTAAGVEVKLGVLEKQARQLNAGFFHFQEKSLPLVTLKWACSADGFMAELGKTRTVISEGMAQAFVHRLRANHMAILVGFNTALYDNPLLTNRSGKGKNPLRIVVDPQGELPADLRVFQGAEPAWRFEPCTKDWVPELLQILASKGIQSILVEGGRETLGAFLAAQAWDRLIQVQNTERVLGQGLVAPQVPGDPPHALVDLGADRVRTWVKQEALALPDHFYSPV